MVISMTLFSQRERGKDIRFDKYIIAVEKSLPNQ
jgi:hypothetical protein